MGVCVLVEVREIIAWVAYNQIAPPKIKHTKKTYIGLTILGPSTAGQVSLYVCVSERIAWSRPRARWGALLWLWPTCVIALARFTVVAARSLCRADRLVHGMGHGSCTSSPLF